MKDPAIDALLLLQTYDMRRIALEGRIAEGPKLMAQLDAKVDRENADFEAKRKALSDLERARSQLRTQRRSLEAQVAKYKVQQTEVRKNEEYQALSKQIAESEAKAGDMETEELDLLFQIDSAKARVEEDEKEHRQRLAALDEMRAQLSAQLAEFEKERQAEILAAEQAAGKVDPVYLKAYEQVKKMGKRPPFVAPIQNHVCSGCHIRASGSDVADSKNAPTKPIFCGNCGRMVYAPQ